MGKNKIKKIKPPFNLIGDLLYQRYLNPIKLVPFQRIDIESVVSLQASSRAIFLLKYEKIQFKFVCS